MNNESKEKSILIGSGKPVSIWKLLYHFSDKKDIIILPLALIGCVGHGASMPLFAILFGNTINGLGDLSNNLTNTINTLVLRFIYIGLGMTGAAFLNVSFWQLNGMRSMIKLRKEYFKVIMRQDQGWFDTSNAFEFSTKVMAQVKQIEAGVGDKIGNVLYAFSMFISAIIIAFVISWKLTLALLGVVPFMAIGVYILVKKTQNSSILSRKMYEKAGGIAEEVIYSIKTVASFANFDYERKRYNDCLEESFISTSKSIIISSLGTALVLFFFYCGFSAALYFGSYLIYSKEYNSVQSRTFQAGDVLTCLFGVVFAAISLGNAAPNYRAASEACLAASDLFELMDRVPVVSESKVNLIIPKDEIKGRLIFNNVCFSYPSNPENLILKNISYDFGCGKKTAIVGESGSGKSTIVNLLERLYVFTSGNITIDGIDITDFELRYYRSLIGYVQQEPVLFNTTIRENIIFGREKITDSMIEVALEEAYASEFVNLLPDKLNYIVGIKGCKLSGGQRQRIAIARAIVTKPKLLILDEATSALDNQSEKEVQKALDNVSTKTTTIIIAHRLTTIKNADSIVVIGKSLNSNNKSGEILEIGTHEELMDKCGYYAAMFQSQISDKEEEGISDTIQETLGLVDEDKNLILEKKEKRIETLDSNTSNVSPTARVFGLLKDCKCIIFTGSFFTACAGAVWPMFGLVLAMSMAWLSSLDMSVVKTEGSFVALMFLVIAVSAGVSSYFQNLKFLQIGEILVKRFRELVFCKYLEMDMGFFDASINTPGALITRLASDTTKINSVVLSIIGVVVQSVVCVVVGVVLGLVYSWKIALIAIGFLPLIVGNQALQYRLRKGLIQGDDVVDSEAGSILSESVVSTKTVFSYNLEKKVCLMYDDILTQSEKGIPKKCFVDGVLFGIGQFILFACFGTLFYAGGQFMTEKNSTLTLGDFFKSMFVVIYAAFGIGQTQQYMGDLSQAKEALGNLLLVLNQKTKINPSVIANENKLKPEKIFGNIEFVNVSFSYPTRPSHIVLNNINFKIKAGQKIAFVGFSGSGKSTIIQLLERFYDVTTGEILIDGVNIKDYSLPVLRRYIGLVMQEPSLFKTTVLENIRYGKLGSSDEEVEKAAISARISKFFTADNKGTKDTPVSGGEKQRIAIARVILKNPSILLLDEATSALDRDNETEVQKSLDELMVKRTSIVVAHRLKTILDADNIFVMQKGEIAESGSHSELLKIKGSYYTLYRSQDK